MNRDNRILSIKCVQRHREKRLRECVVDVQTHRCAEFTPIKGAGLRCGTVTLESKVSPYWAYGFLCLRGDDRAGDHDVFYIPDKYWRAVCQAIGAYNTLYGKLDLFGKYGVVRW